MFKKIVSNLPFNPSMITALGFYSDRLKKERGIRRLSFVFIALTMVLQILVVASPPQRSLAASSNHIIDDLKTRDDILRAWDAPGSDVSAIYGVFGVTRQDILNLPQNPNTTVTSRNGANQDLWTIGRSSIQGRSDIKAEHRNSQLSVRYAGENTATSADDQFVYMRNLESWNIRNSSNSYRAFQGKLADGRDFWILTDCGNFTQRGKWSPPPVPPAPTPPPTPTISAVCSIVGPIVLPEGTNTARIPVRIGLPAGSSVPKGTSDAIGNGRGLHLGVTTKGGNTKWNVTDIPTLNSGPPYAPDNQTDYLPLATDLDGLARYNFVWDRDGFNYNRYYVTEAHSSSFDVVLNVQVNKLDKSLVIRLLDREQGKWLDHNSACEVPITRRETPPPPPAPPTPEVVLRKTIENSPTSLKQGDTLTYNIEYRNKVPNSLAENVEILDELETKYFDVISPSDLNVNNGLLRYSVGGLGYTPDFNVLSITVRLKDQLPSGTKVCNAASITSTNADRYNGKPACTDVLNKCPIDIAINLENSDCFKPVVACKVVTASVNLTTRKVTFKTTADSTNPIYTSIKKYSYDFGDGQSADFETGEIMHTTTHTYAPGDYDAEVTLFFTTNNQEQEGDQSETCVTPITFEADQPFGQKKTVENITQGKKNTDATSSVVQAGDVLEYTLITNNSQGYERLNIDVSDYVGDILDYAVIDETFLLSQGGTYDKGTNKIIWSGVTLDANSSKEHKFRVTLKNPIPTTNAPSSVSASYDCRISNAYGNEITLNINCPLVKGLETLPNTGPGSSLAAMTGVTIVVGYFFSRSRLLAKETGFVRQDYVATGGM